MFFSRASGLPNHVKKVIIQINISMNCILQVMDILWVIQSIITC